MTPLQIELAINGLIILANAIASNINVSKELTEEEKKSFLARLTNLQAAVNATKFPV